MQPTQPEAGEPKLDARKVKPDGLREDLRVHAAGDRDSLTVPARQGNSEDKMPAQGNILGGHPVKIFNLRGQVDN